MDDEIAEAEGSHEPTEFKKEPGKAVASGWIGSALEYYDFFVYATAASLVFPDVFFPKGNPKVAIIESLATYGVGYGPARSARSSSADGETNAAERMSWSCAC